MAKSAVDPRGFDEATYLVSFLDAIQPLDGCDYSNDERFQHGDELIRHRAAALLRGESPSRLTRHDAADLLFLMHNIQPVEGRRIFDGEGVHCGYCAVLRWAESSLRGVRHG